MKKFVGIIGGAVGHDPFDPRSWSGTSRRFFGELQRQGKLHRAFGIRVSPLEKNYILARTFGPNRRAWRKRFNTSPLYRDALTRQLRSHLEPADFGNTVLQIGAQFDAPGVIDGRSRCDTYNDGNLVESVKSRYWSGELDSKAIDRSVAYERKVHQRADRVLTMSEYLRRSFIENYDLPPDRVVNIGGAINLDAVPEPVPGKRYDTREILFIGVEFERKGGWQLLKAFRAVRELVPDAKLHIVGPRQLAIPAELERGVVYHGYLNKNQPEERAKLDALIRDSCLFVMPSLYEPFGIAPLEAMAHQIPCVVTNGWALKEAIIPGETGELVEIDNVDDLVAKMSALLRDEDLLRRMGEAGRRSVVERFTWEQVVRRMDAE